jgi:hypothetical protein
MQFKLCVAFNISLHLHISYVPDNTLNNVYLLVLILVALQYF